MRKSINFIYVVLLMLTAAAAANAQSPAVQMQKADSLYYAGDWATAKAIYTPLLGDTSHNAAAWNRLGFCNYNTGDYKAAMADYQKALNGHPRAPLKASAFSRMARINAMQNRAQLALGNIDSAITSGYVAYGELDSLKDFASVRGSEAFKKLREKAFITANPCMADPKARVFDFWAGRWNVYATGTNVLVGHSVVQVISGGCALLENWESLGNASTGKSLNFIDANGKWRQCWIGSYPKGQQDFVDGEYRDSAMRFTFTTTDAQGHKLTGRFIFYNEGPDKVRQFNETSADDGKTWTTGYDFTYLRAK